MAFITKIVDVAITLNTTASNRAEFNIPMFVYDAGAVAAPDVDFGSGIRTRIYTDLQTVIDDFTTGSPVVAATQFFAQNPSVTQIIIGQQYTEDADAVAAVTAISLETDDWYVLTHEDHTSATVLALAAYIEARQKLYFVSTDVAASIDTVYTTGPAVAGDIAGLLKDQNYDRTIHIWHDDADTQFIECDFSGHNLPFLPGTATWAYLQMNGVAAAVNTDAQLLTATQQTNLANRSSNMVIKVRGVTITREGVSVSGEAIDIVRGADDLDETITANGFDLLVNQLGGKVNFTDAGINQVRGTIADGLTEFVGRDFILDDYTIVMPLAADVPTADKIAGVLQNITFEATLVGAIKTIKIIGNLSFG